MLPFSSSSAFLLFGLHIRKHPDVLKHACLHCRVCPSHHQWETSNSLLTELEVRFVLSDCLKQWIRRKKKNLIYKLLLAGVSYQDFVICLHHLGLKAYFLCYDYVLKIPWHFNWLRISILLSKKQTRLKSTASGRREILPSPSLLKAAHFLHKFTVHRPQLLQNLQPWCYMHNKNLRKIQPSWAVIDLQQSHHGCLTQGVQAKLFIFYFSIKELQRKRQKKLHLAGDLQSCEGFLRKLQCKMATPGSGFSFSALSGLDDEDCSPLELATWRKTRRTWWSGTCWSRQGPAHTIPPALTSSPKPRAAPCS